MKKRYAKPTVVTCERCLVDGCGRPEELINGRSAGGFCSAHRKRKLQQRSLSAPIRNIHPQPLKSILADTAMELADVDTSDDRAFDRVLRRFSMRVNRHFSRTKGSKR